MALRDEVMKQLNKNPDAEWPAGEIAKKLGYDNTGQLGSVFSELVADGSIVRVSRGIYRAADKPSSNGAPAATGDTKLTFRMLKRKGDQLLLLGSDGEVYAARPFSW